MPKVFFTLAITFSGLVAADRQYSYGVYTDAALNMVRHMLHSFGW